MCGITSPSVVRDELISTCSPELEKQLFHMAGIDLNSFSEVQLLDQIREVAVRGLSVEVHRHQFHSLRQSQGEDVTQFISRLRSKASLCSFSVMAHRPTAESLTPGSVSYEEDVLRTQMIVGLYDKDHQNRILTNSDKYSSFKEIYQALQTMEAADTSRLKLSSESSLSTADLAAAQKSQYQRERRDRAHLTAPHTKEQVVPCRWCGGTTHETSSRWQHERCPARGQMCRKCGKSNHHAKVCQSNSGPPSRPPGRRQDETSAQTHAEPQEEGEVSFCFSQGGQQTWTEDHSPAGTDKIPHQEWQEGKFVDSSPKSHPEVKVQLTVMHAAHEKLGRHISPSVKTRMMNDVHHVACADTGAMTCTSGPELLQVLRCPRHYMLRTTHRIQGVTGDGLQIIGTLMVRIALGDHVTRQVVYITNNTSGLYLSESALRDLQVIHPEFPDPLPTRKVHAPGASAACTSEGPGTATCGCLTRSEAPDPPPAIPFSPTEENRHKLEEWIKQHFASSAFNVCEHQPLPLLSGAPMDIRFKSDTTPQSVHVPIPIPYHWKHATKSDLDRDVQLGVIEPVPQGTPTIWCSRMVVTGKSDGSPRRTVDLQKVNDATLRETHHTPTPYNLVADVPPRTVKTVLDAWNGYHSLLLAPTARDATTFITEFGRYRYLRAPQGFHASGDAYTRRISDIIDGIPRVKQCIDDALLWDQDIEASFWHTLEYITRCARNGVVFNPNKFVFGSQTVNFAGFTIDQNGYRPTDKMLSAISEFPTPSSITGVRSWFGLINQVAYAFAQSSTMAPFRELLKAKGTRFYWDDSLNTLFEQSKKIVVDKVREGVKSFEIHRPTCLSTDWSKSGIGFLLQQKHCSCPLDKAPHCGAGHWRLIFAGSRFTTEAESRYAPVEGESLALVYGLEQCRMFVMGCPSLTVAVDHKPLVKIFSDQSLENIKNPRIFRLKERSLLYRFQMKYVPGGDHAAPDAASRHPVGPQSTVASAGAPDSVKSLVVRSLRRQPTDEDTNAADILHTSMLQDISAAATSCASETIRAITWELVKQEAHIDKTCIDLVQIIENGFPASRTDVPDHLKPFWNMRHNLYQVESVPFLDHKMLIPHALRTEVLESLHSAHQGEIGMKNSARQRFFWPGMDAHIAQKRAQCRTCAGMSPSQPREPMMDTPTPEFPFQMACCDYFELAGHHYLVYADRYSGWLDLVKVQDGTFRTLSSNLRRWFAQWGVPRILETDGGPPFNGGPFSAFMEQWGVKHRLSSAYYAQSNGRAELAVKTAKRLLRDNTGKSGELDTNGVTRALLQYRNTPLRETDDSPAEIIYGRRLRDGLPTPTDGRPEWKRLRVLREQSSARLHARVVDRYNQHTRPLCDLDVGNVVLLQNQNGSCPRRWDLTGVIVDKLDNRQYRVKIDGSGRVTLRNRRFLKLLQPFMHQSHSNSPSSAPSVPARPTPEPAPRPASHIIHDTIPQGQYTSTLYRTAAPSTPGRIVDAVRQPTDTVEDPRGSPKRPQGSPAVYPRVGSPRLVDSPWVAARAGSPRPGPMHRLADGQRRLPVTVSSPGGGATELQTTRAETGGGDAGMHQRDVRQPPTPPDDIDIARVAPRRSGRRIVPRRRLSPQLRGKQHYLTES